MSGKKLYELLPKHKRIIDATSHRLPHMIYDISDIETIDGTHKPPKKIRDKLAYHSVSKIRKVFDVVTRYNENNMTKRQWMFRCIFLETVAGVPGMVAGMARHLRSLRLMVRDHGWIHHLLEEADNERFHLFTFLNERNPGILFRSFIVVS